jgi:putative membrane protein
MLRLIPALVVILILALFALSNRQDVTLGLWPTDYAAQLPLSGAILIGMAVAFFLGAAMVWIDHLGLGRRARQAEAQVARLQAQLAQAELRQTEPAFTGQGAIAARRPEPVLPPPES